MRNAGTVLIAATALLAGCGGDSNDSTPFEPAAMAADLDFGTMFTSGPVSEFFLLAPHIDDEMGGGPMVEVSAIAIRAARQPGMLKTGADALQADALSLVQSGRVANGMAAVIIPNELQGTTYEWDVDLDEYQPTARTGAPATGVRFIVYAVDPIAGVPVEPLQEVGRLDMTDGSTATTDAIRIQLVSANATYVDYSLAVTETASGGTVHVDGFLDDGDDRLEFGTELTVSATGLRIDYDLDIPSRDVAMSYVVTSNEAGLAVDFEVSGPNGHISLTGGTTAAGEEYVFEVNGEEYATLNWSEETGDVWTGADGEPLSDDEMDALGNALDVVFTGLLITNQLMFPVGGMI